MKPHKFVAVCLLYIGGLQILLQAIWVVVEPPQEVSFETLGPLMMLLLGILFVGDGYRRWDQPETSYGDPESYGTYEYVFAGFAILMTGLFIASLLFLL